MAMRENIDWERVKNEYRVGQFSLREIATRNGIAAASSISRRAKKEGWPRDLSDRVCRETREQLLAGSNTLHGQHVQRAEEIVAQSVARNVEVVTTHRKDLQQLTEMKRVIAMRLEAFLNGQTPDGAFIGDKESPADVLEKLSRVTSRLIPLQRQAFNLDDARNSDDTHEAFLARAMEAAA